MKYYESQHLCNVAYKSAGDVQERVDKEISIFGAMITVRLEHDIKIKKNPRVAGKCTFWVSIKTAPCL
jgi:hypothetical protein